MWMNVVLRMEEAPDARIRRLVRCIRPYRRRGAHGIFAKLTTALHDAFRERTTTVTTTVEPSVTVTTTAERVWRMAGIVGMVLGVASFMAATVIQWVIQPSDPAATPIAMAQANPTVWLIAGFLGVVGPLVWVAGIVSITMVVRTRGWALTTIGGYITAAGLIAGVGHLAQFFGLMTDAAGAKLDPASSTALLSADESSLLATVLLFAFLIGYSLGPVLLTIGLRRAKLVPVWVPVAAIVLVVTNFLDGIPAGIVQLVAIIVTFGSMVLVLARQKDVAP